MKAADHHLLSEFCIIWRLAVSESHRFIVANLTISEALHSFYVNASASSVCQIRGRSFLFYSASAHFIRFLAPGRILLSLAISSRPASYVYTQRESQISSNFVPSFPSLYLTWLVIRRKLNFKYVSEEHFVLASLEMKVTWALNVGAVGKKTRSCFSSKVHGRKCSSF